MDLIAEKRYRGYSWIAWSDDGYNHKVLIFKQLSQSMWKPVGSLEIPYVNIDEYVKDKIDEAIINEDA